MHISCGKGEESLHWRYTNLSCYRSSDSHQLGMQLLYHKPLRSSHVNRGRTGHDLDDYDNHRHCDRRADGNQYFQHDGSRN
jgi:hypothetical protein